MTLAETLFIATPVLVLTMIYCWDYAMELLVPVAEPS